MNLDLAAMYGTNGVTAEDTEKLAQEDLFAKLAADNGIDLSSLTDEQVHSLRESTFGKQAEEEKKDDDDEETEEHKDEDEKKEAAAAEFAAVAEWKEKQAEADYLGRLMAHAYVAELNEIKEAGAKELFGKGVDKAGKHLESVGKKTMKHVGRTGGAEGAANPTTAKRVGAGVYGAGAAAAGAAAASSKKKQSSAIDELALEEALKLAHAQGWDVDEAAQRVNAVATLGLDASDKIASATDSEGAVQIRALEYLEAAGYPVSWGE